MEISAQELAQLLEEVRRSAVAKECLEKDQIVCPSCGESNFSRHEVCYSCGTNLTLKGLYEATQKAEEADAQQYNELRQKHEELLKKTDYMKERRDKELARSNNTLQTWVRIRNLIDRNITRSPDERLSDALEKEFKPKDVYLTSYPRDKKIACIKLIREILGLGLKDAKDLSESIPNALLSQNVDAAHRDALFVMFKDIGATIEAREIGKHPIADLVEIPQSDDWVQRCGYDPYNPNVG